MTTPGQKIFSKWAEIEGKTAKVTGHFNDIRLIKSIDQISRSNEWVIGLVTPGDTIKVIEIKSECTDPGCCPASVIFTLPDLPEAGMLEGEMYRPDQRLMPIV